MKDNKIKREAFLYAEDNVINRVNVSIIDGYIAGAKSMNNKACKVFHEILVEICPELLGYGAMAIEWENEFRKRLEE